MFDGKLFLTNFYIEQIELNEQENGRENDYNLEDYIIKFSILLLGINIIKYIKNI